VVSSKINLCTEHRFPDDLKTTVLARDHYKADPKDFVSRELKQITVKLGKKSRFFGEEKNIV